MAQPSAIHQRDDDLSCPVHRCDGPLLGALKSGQWVLLDELNLASQSVLEGLNALLDHRAEVCYCLIVVEKSMLCDEVVVSQARVCWRAGMLDHRAEVCYFPIATS